MPANPGDTQDAIETPALVVDVDAFERNLDRMAEATRAIRLRPHAKSHKCSTIAKAQLARGAVGICCQKTDEAAAFVAAGITDVLVTNEVVAPAKVARLVDLARSARIGVLVDAIPAVTTISQAATRAGVVADVYIEVDVGAHRCGVAPGAPALELARAIAQ
jgi:D-serine deaminase-like pyridoxal phosphate-dependent protein